jgi:hypothetical protein
MVNSSFSPGIYCTILNIRFDPKRIKKYEIIITEYMAEKENRKDDRKS